jgi:hypothetical protein
MRGFVESGVGAGYIAVYDPAAAEIFAEGLLEENALLVAALEEQVALTLFAEAALRGSEKLHTQRSDAEALLREELLSLREQLGMVDDLEGWAG